MRLSIYQLLEIEFVERGIMYKCSYELSPLVNATNLIGLSQINSVSFIFMKFIFKH